MRKKINLYIVFLLPLCLLFSNNSFGQDQIQILFKESESVAKGIKNLPPQVQLKLKELAKNYKEHLLKIELKNGKSEYKFEKYSANSRTVKDTKIVFQKNLSERNLKLSSNLTDKITTFSFLDFEWTITEGVTKKILGYDCFEAIGKDFSGKPVKAYFTTEIPISEGPKYYTGLPGIILEIIEPNRTIVATGINFCFDNKIIELVPNTALSLDKYYALLRSNYMVEVKAKRVKRGE